MSPNEPPVSVPLPLLRSHQRFLCRLLEDFLGVFLYMETCSFEHFCRPLLFNLFCEHVFEPEGKQILCSGLEESGKETCRTPYTFSPP